MKMHHPPHPGEVLRELCLKPLGLTVTQTARALGVSRKTLSSILNGRAGISPEMAVRLSLAFGTTAELDEPADSARPLARRTAPQEAARGEVVCRVTG
jgi:addiction module HigA family antidote